MARTQRQQVFTRWRIVRLLSMTLVLAVLSNYVLMALITWTPQGPLKSRISAGDTLLAHIGLFSKGGTDVRFIVLRERIGTDYTSWRTNSLIDIVEHTSPRGMCGLSSMRLLETIDRRSTQLKPIGLPVDEILADFEDLDAHISGPFLEPRVTWIAVGWPMRSMHAITAVRYTSDYMLIPPAWPTLTHAWNCPQTGLPYRETFSAPVLPLWPGFAINTALYWLVWIALLGTLLYARPLWRSRRGRCIRCGYDLDDLASDRCPECGVALDGEAADVRPAIHFAASGSG